MGELGNPRHEKFAKLTATGAKRADAYLAAGYHTKTREVATKRGVRLYARSEIRARVTEIETELRHHYSLAYSPRIVRHDGSWHAIEVRVRQPGARVNARRGYYAALDRTLF